MTTTMGNAVMPQHNEIKLLLIDDEANNWAGMFDQGLRPLGFELFIETQPERVAAAIQKTSPDVILLDLRFPGDDMRKDQRTTGGELLSMIRQRFPNIPIVVFTTQLHDTKIQLESFEHQPNGWFGKHQIAEKQKVGEEWASILAQALKRAIDSARIDPRTPDSEMGFVVGSTEAMTKVVDLIRNAAKHSLTVLIYGETGVGKQGVAEAIHKLSGCSGRFEHLNCSGVNGEMLTAQLFGHTKDAFTGAVVEKKGLFELADSGTLFLDEIQGMPHLLQDKLMTVLEQKLIRRMGGVTDINVNMRVIVATNQPLSELVNNGNLRGDLAHRLNHFPIDLPPLRERMQDLPTLFLHFIAKANRELNKHVTDVLRPEVMSILEAYDWPGNIRELETEIMRAVATTSSNVILPADINISGYVNGSSNATTVKSNTENMEAQAAFATTIDGMPVEDRYSFLTENFDGEMRKLILTEIVRILRNRHDIKVQHKALADYLDVITDKKKDYMRIRQMVISAGVLLKKLECNQ